MIRINLLESERAASSKPKAAAAAGSAPGGGGSGVGPYVPLLGGLIIAALGCGYFFMSLTNEIDDTNQRIVTAKAEVAKLAPLLGIVAREQGIDLAGIAHIRHRNERIGSE